MAISNAKQYKLTEKQKTFAFLLFQGVYQNEAYLTVYKPRSTNSYSSASKLARKPKIVHEIERLRSLVEANITNSVHVKAILSAQQRKEILTEIAKNPTKNRDGIPMQPWRVQAIEALNKMEEKLPVPDNRSINIIVSSEQGKDLVNKLLAGRQPGETPIDNEDKVLDINPDVT